MLKLYNTLTRRKEDFIPINKDNVTMYSCGPTVYNYAHIGNLRTYVFMDMLRRVLKYNGYNITGVMNITDVGHLTDDGDDGEDKMVKASEKLKKSPYEIAEYFTSVFFKDIEKININKPEHIVKATDHIKEMIDFVKVLIDNGYAYEIEDGIYYDISKFNNYGKLSCIKLDEQISGARVEVNTDKKNPADFALWKKAPREHIMKWDSPWGIGYPGWHIECSAMSRKYLGLPFDIHSGGVDHVPIHHENEIAQNEGYCGHKSVNYWLHGEFMLVNNGKMSKSLGNTYTISNLEDMGYSPLDFRYFCLNAHYRKKLNFTFTGLDAAKVARARLNALLYAHKISDSRTDSAIISKYKKEFENAILDDINIPLALGILWTMVKEEKSVDIYNLSLTMDNVLGLSLDMVSDNSKDDDKLDIPTEINELLIKRNEAKANKNYALADSIRDTIVSKGFNIKDTKEGSVLIPIN